MNQELDKLYDKNAITIEDSTSGELISEKIIYLKDTDKYLINFLKSEIIKGHPITYFNLSIPIEINIVRSEDLSLPEYKISSKTFQDENQIKILKDIIKDLKKSKKKEKKPLMILFNKIIGKVFPKVKKIEEIIINRYISNDFLREIIASRKLINLGDNWDGEGSKGYKVETWNKSYKFLLDISKDFYIRNRKYLIAPYIDPGMDGAIDLHWKTNNFELLLTIPEEDDRPLSYYGDDYGNNIFKGSLEIKNFDIILSWMKKFH